MNLIFLCLFLAIYHWCSIAISKGHSSDLKASSCECLRLKACTHRSSLILACHTSTCTLAWNKEALASDFLAFVSTKQSYNFILNRMLTLTIFLCCYERPTFNYHSDGKVTQSGEMEKKVVDRWNWTSSGSRREIKPVIRLNFIKTAELADWPLHHLCRYISGSVTKCEFTGACELIGDL